MERNISFASLVVDSVLTFLRIIAISKKLYFLYLKNSTKCTLMKEWRKI
jgi:hypothetical protein